MVFIDGANLNEAQGRYQQGYKVDLLRLVERLIRNRKLVAVYYYGSEKGSKQTRFAKVRNAFNFQLNQFRFEKQVDVALAVDMLDNAWRDLYDICVLISGDQDFIPAIKKIKYLDKQVEVVSFENSLSYPLRREASDVVTLDEAANYIRLA